MQFRCVVVITLWTVLIGPVLGPPLPRPADSAAAHTPSVNKLLPKAVPNPRR